MRRELLALAVACCAAAALAQPSGSDPDWRESEAPPPPPLRTSGLIPIDMPQSTLKFGVQPDSVSVGKDGIVRYVVVASSSSGAVNAMYEGIRCERAEFRTYARHNPDKGWVAVDAPWQPLHDSALSSRHSLLIARTAACIGHGTNATAADVVRDLRRPGPDRFQSQMR